MTRPTLTPAQQRALDWLPRDGSWNGCSHVCRELIFALTDMLTLDFVEKYPVGAFLDAYHLTPLGIATFYGDGK